MIRFRPEWYPFRTIEIIHAQCTNPYRVFREIYANVYEFDILQENSISPSLQWHRLDSILYSYRISSYQSKPPVLYSSTTPSKSTTTTMEASDKNTWLRACSILTYLICRNDGQAQKKKKQLHLDLLNTFHSDWPMSPRQGESMAILLWEFNL